MCHVNSIRKLLHLNVFDINMICVIFSNTEIPTQILFITSKACYNKAFNN